MAQRYCPDTNFFLHARAPQELPWSDITQADSVELVLVDEVLEELDGRKHLGNQRVARRAKKLLEKLDPLFEGEAEVVLRQSRPRVSVRMAPVSSGLRVVPQGLNLDKADNRILDQCMAAADALGEQVVFLTNDRRPHMTARRLGLPSLRIPDTWLLAEEPDEQGKEIQRLKEENRRLTQRLPQVEVALLVDGKPVERLEGTVQRFRPHTEESLEEAVDVVIRRHPEERRGIPGSIVITRDLDWERYQDERREWLGKVRDVIDGFPRWLTLQRGLFNAELVLHNAGSATAEGLVVRVEVEGPLRLVNLGRHEELLEKGTVALPKPPALPTATGIFMQGLLQARADSVAQLARMPVFPTPQMARDPLSLYWDRGRDVLTESMSAECEDFRHGLGEFVEPIALFARDPDTPRLEGCLRVVYSARNLPQSVSKRFPIALDVEWVEADEASRELLMG